MSELWFGNELWLGNLGDAGIRPIVARLGPQGLRATQHPVATWLWGVDRNNQVQLVEFTEIRREDSCLVGKGDALLLFHNPEGHAMIVAGERMKQFAIGAEIRMEFATEEAAGVAHRVALSEGNVSLLARQREKPVPPPIPRLLNPPWWRRWLLSLSRVMR